MKIRAKALLWVLKLVRNSLHWNMLLCLSWLKGRPEVRTSVQSSLRILSSHGHRKKNIVYITFLLIVYLRMKVHLDGFQQKKKKSSFETKILPALLRFLCMHSMKFCAKELAWKTKVNNGKKKKPSSNFLFFTFSGQIGMWLCTFQALSILSKGLCLKGYVETNTDVSLVSFRI